MRVNDLVDHIWNMGPMTQDHLRCVGMLNSLSTMELSPLRDQIHLQFSQSTTFKSTDMVTCLHSSQLMQSLDAGSVSFMPSSITSAFAATTPSNCAPICSNCKKSRHLPSFCIALGSRMEGQSIETTHDVQCASRPS